MTLLLKRGLAAVALLSLCACSNVVEVDSPDLNRTDRTSCDTLLEELPDELDGLQRVDVTPDGAPALAWGDPAVVVTCGVAMPEDFDEMSPCEEINGVGWFVRPDEYADNDSALDMTSIGFYPAVRLQVPPEHRPPAGFLVAVSDAIKASLERTGDCV